MTNPEFQDVHIETILPKPWEEEQTFNDVLYEWMSRAPWLVISALAHLLALFILSAIPWDEFFKEEPKTIQAQIEQPPPDPFEEPPEEPEEEIEEEPIEEPVLKDAEVVDTPETDNDSEFEETAADPAFDNNPFDSDAFNDVLGIGGGAGGGSGKMGGRGGKRNAGGRGTQAAVRDGLEWLKNHQSPDGYWDSDEYHINNVMGGSDCGDGLGSPLHDVGITGLALLAFLGDGHTTNSGHYRDVVSKGVNWLREIQDPDTGQFGDRASHEFLYNHGIATLAMTEAYYFSKSPILKGTTQKAVDFIQRARNPYAAWRYEVPPDGESDSSVTGWMLFALASARDGGLRVDPASIQGGLNFIDEVTDPQTGRTGYTAMGTLSSRVPGVNDHFPRELTETLTAVGLLSRIFMGQDPKEYPAMIEGADLLLARLPEWDDEGLGCDMYYWYYGTYAMFQMDAYKSGYWKAWKGAIEKAIVPNQRKDGDCKGSWDPVGPWGFSGGRVYSTALMVLCLEVYYRYAKVLGAR
jgi:hypothetical protein